MTQTVQGPQLPPGYATGVPSSPVSAVPGVLGTIPYPAPKAGGAVPTLLTWVVILNSSPYTLLVSSGATVTQIAAFTSDLLLVQASQAAQVTFLPQPGIAQVAPGSDSTVYATWYEAKPPGQYPAALGAGAVATQVSTLLDNEQIPFLGAGGAIKGPFNVTGYGSVRCTLGELSGNGPVQFLFSWVQNGPFNAVRLIGLEAGGAISVILPNLTDILQILVSNNTVANVTAVLELHAYTPALYTFDDESLSGPLVRVTQNAVPSGNSMTAFSGPSPGPAKISANCQANPGGLGWSVTVSADTGGDNSYSDQLYFSGKLAGDTQNRFINDDLFLAAVPMKYVVTNGTGAAQNLALSVVTDAYRAG